jgi:transglutaminase-like putative cysteine protease
VVGVSVPVVFALDHPVGVELPAAKMGTVADLKLAPRWSGEVAVRIAPLDTGLGDSDEMRAYGGTHYVAYSRDSLSVARASLGRPLADLDPVILQTYLALPSSLSPRVTELARQITAGRTNPPAKLVALMDWLRTTHEYTTNLPRHPTGVDPLEDFLFENKGGHCEYFASAITVLLRASGVPSRYVNGFLGGEWNDIGRYITVRDNRAHSWAEAYVGELGWVRVDATPSAPAGLRWGRLRQLIDSVDFFWTRWVVGYDIGRQLELARKLGRRMGVTHNNTDGARPFKLPVGRQVGIVVGIAVVVWVVWRFARRPWSAPKARVRTWKPPSDAAPVVRLYHRVLDRLARRGLARRLSETPREHAVRVVQANVRASDEMERLTNLYTAARFGGRPVDDEVVRDLARALRQVGLPLHTGPS